MIDTTKSFFLAPPNMMNAPSSSAVTPPPTDKTAPLSLASHGEGVRVVRLSDIHGNAWRDTENTAGLRPCVNFAISEPFQLLTPASAAHLKDVALRELGGESEYSTARTSACIRGSPALEGLMKSMQPELEDMATRLVGNGMRLKMVKMNLEHAHLNVQREVQDHPVDNWHQDSTPFVLIIILTDHTNDPGGNLLVRHNGTGTKQDQTYRWKLTKPGEACLVQGSHIWHMAQQSEVGERFTLVTSFYCDDPVVYDITSINAGLQYSDPVCAVNQFLDHCLSRISENAVIVQRLALVSPSAALDCNMIIKREVEKMIHQYQSGWQLIPTERKTLPVTEVWSQFQEIVVALDDAIVGCKRDQEIFHYVGDVAKRMHGIVLNSSNKSTMVRQVSACF